MAKCGRCKFWKDFMRDDKGYLITPHCQIHEVNYYGSNDKSERPRLAYLPVTADDRACEKYYPIGSHLPPDNKSYSADPAA